MKEVRFPGNDDRLGPRQGFHCLDAGLHGLAASLCTPKGRKVDLRHLSWRQIGEENTQRQFLLTLLLKNKHISRARSLWRWKGGMVVGPAETTIFHNALLTAGRYCTCFFLGPASPSRFPHSFHPPFPYISGTNLSSLLSSPNKVSGSLPTSSAYGCPWNFPLFLFSQPALCHCPPFHMGERKIKPGLYSWSWCNSCHALKV